MTLAAVILSAGQGTRMHSALPKALHPLGGLPLVELRAALKQDSVSMSETWLYRWTQ